jgi:hypothetical protein
MSVATEMAKTMAVGLAQGLGLVDLTYDQRTAGPTVLTTKSTEYSTLPTECDRQPRITSIAVHPTLKTTMALGDLYVTVFSINSTSSIPFTAYNTGIKFNDMQPIPHLDCHIPPTECSTQWNLFLDFVRSTRPDVGDFNGLYQLLTPELDSFQPSINFEMMGFNVHPGYMVAESGLLTGSPFLDGIMQRAHGYGAGMKVFFGGCPQAQKMAIKDCQHRLEERMSTKLSTQLSNLSVEDAINQIVEKFGCSLHAAHARVIHFAEEQALGRKRDICANNGWGEDIASSITLPGKLQKTAVMPAITFPSYFDNGQ